MTCESALRVAEWRLAEQQRRSLAARSEAKSGQPVAAARPSRGQLWLLWIVVDVLVLSAIALSLRWADERVEIPSGLWIVVLVAFVAAAVIVFVVVLTSWRWKTRRGGR